MYIWVVSKAHARGMHITLVPLSYAAYTHVIATEFALKPTFAARCQDLGSQPTVCQPFSNI